MIGGDGLYRAIGKTLPGICSDALAVCRKKNIPVYCDINYRPTLWTPDQAGPVMRELITGIDTLVANEEHAGLLLGVTSEIGNDMMSMDAQLRQSSSSDNNTVSAVMYTKDTGKFVKSRSHRVHIVDRVGGGDALSAGLIYCSLHGMNDQDTIEFASAANAFKHSIHGDALMATADEISRLAGASDGTVRMIR